MNILKMGFTICLILNIIGLPVYAEQMAGVVSPKLIINLPSRTIDLYSQDFWLKEYPIAIGKPSTPTPLGTFSVIYKEINPSWYPKIGGEIVPSGPDNPLGYRWMRFVSTYGIHGTNAPWAIGSAVSNGCIRMQEADAEELFDIIPLGTPVSVVYDRCKVRLDRNGEASIGIYPDVYGYGNLEVEEVKNKLAEYNLNGWLSDDYLLQVIQEAGDSQTAFAQMINIKVNDSILPTKAVQLQDVNYIPIRAVAEALGINITWDEQTQVVRSDRGSAPGQLKSNLVYVLLEDMQSLLGVRLVWNEGENCLEIKAAVVLLNDKLIGNDMQRLDGIWAVPVLPLAKALGQPATWDSAKTILIVKNGKFPVGLIGDQPYIKIIKIYDCFNAYTYWNEKAAKLELTYPFYPN